MTVRQAGECLVQVSTPRGKHLGMFSSRMTVSVARAAASETNSVAIVDEIQVAFTAAITACRPPIAASG